MTVGLLLTNMYNDFFGPLLQGIESIVRENKYSLLVSTCNNDDHSNNSLPIGAHNTDGMLIYANTIRNYKLTELRSQDLPIVFIHQTAPEHLSIPCVTVENKAATYMLVSHLIEVHSRRRIVLMKGPANEEDAYWRELGYRNALHDHGIDVDPDLLLEGEFLRDVAYRSMKDFINNRIKHNFDAVFTGDDDAAIGVIQALMEFGYRIPEDVSVAGFDDSRLSAFLNPSLTTVRAPTEEVGRIAARNLINLIKGQQVDLVTLLPTEIIYRQSCGCNGS